MGYFRKIIYLYENNNGIRGENIGFAKINKKGTKGKVEINLSKELSYKNKDVFTVYHDSAGAYSRFFDTIETDQKNIKLTSETKEADERSGELIGLYIGADDMVLSYGSDVDTWDILSVIGKGKETTKTVEPDAVAAEQVDEPSFDSSVDEVSEEETDTVEKMSTDENAPEKVEAKEVIQTEETEVAQETAASSAVANADTNEEVAEEEPEIVQFEMEPEHDERYEYDKLFRTKPNMYPFDDDEMEECVQISPGDFSDFPKKYWQLGSNSFLQQGYYNYRHLILARKEDKVYVGIPGQYHRRDRYLAEMFGFNLFKGIHKRQVRLGDFGYWMMEIIVPPSAQSPDLVALGKEEESTESSISQSNNRPEDSMQASVAQP